MDGTPQAATDTGIAPPADDYSRALTAGFSAAELKAEVAKQEDLSPDDIAREHQKIDTAQPIKQAPEPSTALERGPSVPPPPVPAPGVYSPEQEQMALRAADAIQDPEMRMKVKGHLKREYANDAIMDGINAKAREEAEKTAVGQYSHAIQQLRDDPKMDWQTKEGLIKKLTQTMWQDPRLAFGETAGRLEKYMQTLAGIEPTTDLGPGYSKALDGIVSGQISNINQILEMENSHYFTGKGATEIIKRFQQRDKPDAALVNQLEGIAIKRATSTALGKFDENDPTGLNKPGHRQYEKASEVQRALTLEIMAAGGDHEKIRKITAPENVDRIVEGIYPADERNYDFVTRGTGTTVAGVSIPPTVGSDSKSQNEYKWIVGAPPAAINPKTGKQEIVPTAGWQQAIERLRKNPTAEQIADFKKLFPTSDPDHIVKMLPYVTPPPGAIPPPVVAPAPVPAGFWSTLGTRLFPPEGELAKSIREGAMNVIMPQAPPPQEAKK